MSQRMNRNEATLDEALREARANLRERVMREREEARTPGAGQRQQRGQQQQTDEIAALGLTVEATQKRVAALQQALGRHMRDGVVQERIDRRLQQLEADLRELDASLRRELQDTTRSQQVALAQTTARLASDFQGAIRGLMRQRTMGKGSQPASRAGKGGGEA